MRILHVAEAFGGGLLHMVVELAEGNAVAGHEVLIAYGVRPETPEDLRSVVTPAVGLRAMPWTSRLPHGQLRAGWQLRRPRP